MIVHEGMRQGAVIDPLQEPKRAISIRLTVISRMLRRDFERHVEDINITRSQWSMIFAVSRRQGSTQRSIAQILEMSEASAGRLIDRLCADDMLERREIDGDRRARAVYLTKAAKPLLEKLGEVAKAGEAQLFKGFSDTELDELLAYLDRIYANVSGIKDD
jgi:MarR family transcriptional regulator for hemolysin